MESVILGRGEHTAAFTRGVPPEPGDPYNGGDFVVELRASGLSATRRVFVFGWSDVAGFFADLAENWRGWAGPKVWTSPEHDLSLSPSCDSGGHVSIDIDITLRDGPVHTWSASTAVEVEAGEEMTRLARDVGELLPTTAS